MNHFYVVVFVCVCVCVHPCMYPFALQVNLWFPVTHKDFVGPGGSYISIWQIQTIFLMSNLE
jgi:hypothetical protein